MKLTVKVGGVWAHQYGGATDVTYRTLANGGTGPAEFRLQPRSEAIRSGLIDSQHVQYFQGGFPVWRGTVDEIDRLTGRVTTKGLWEAGRTIPALDGAGAVTRDAVAAVATAQGLGWGVSQGSITGTVSGDDTEPVMVTDLLEMLGQQTGKLVGLDPRPGASLYLRARPTTPRWFIRVSDAQLSRMGEQPNAFAGRYTDSSGVRRTMHWPAPLPSPVRMEPVDITRFGRLTSAQAQSVLAGIYSLSRDETQWTNPLTVHLSRITNAGGASPSSAAEIVGGDMARLFLGATARRELGADYVDVILGSVQVTSGSQYVDIEPLGSAPMTIADALEEVAAR